MVAGNDDSRWQPIATAPKDGSAILVWCPAWTWMHSDIEHEARALTARWQTRFNPHDWELLYAPQGAICDELPTDPTHWRPIDPPDSGDAR